jgi:hypothetical protein
MKPISILAALVLIAALSAWGCASKEASSSAATEPASAEKAPPKEADAKAAIEQMMKVQVDALNEEDADAYMATIDPQSPQYGPTRGQIEQLLKSFDMKAVLESFEVVTLKENEAEVRTVITTEKLKGDAPFQDNRVKALHKVVNRDGKWLLAASQIEELEPLKK